MTQGKAQQGQGYDAPPSGDGKRVLIKSYGCQMNVYDSQRMGDLLSADGYAETGQAEDADLVILNTCHIRERATEKIFSELGKLRILKAERAAVGRKTRVVVAGCVAQAEGGEILRRERAVDIVVGPQSYHRLPDMLARAEQGERVVDTEFELDDKFGPPAAAARERSARAARAAFLTIQEGCDKFCTFCVVPYTRGPELSRPVAPILAEARGSPRPACARSRCSGRTSTPTTAKTSKAARRAWPRCAAGSSRHPGGIDASSATRPATPTTWTTISSRRTATCPR